MTQQVNDAKCAIPWSHTAHLALAPELQLLGPQGPSATPATEGRQEEDVAGRIMTPQRYPVLTQEPMSM